MCLTVKLARNSNFPSCSQTGVWERDKQDTRAILMEQNSQRQTRSQTEFRNERKKVPPLKAELRLLLVRSMKPVLALFLVLAVMFGICRTADSAYKPELTLAEFRRMPGVEVFLQPDFAGSSSTRVTIELLDHTNFLGEDFKALGLYTVTAYITVRELERRFIIEAPLRMQHISSGGTLSEKPKENFTSIQFEIDPKLLSNAILRFHVQPQRDGHDVYISFDAHAKSP